MTASSVGIYKSIALHLVVAAVLLISVSFSPSPLPTMATNAPVIEATFIDAQAIADTKREQAQAEAQAREAEAQRKKKEAQAAAAKRKRAAEAKQAREKKQAEEAEFKRQKELEDRKSVV